MRTYYHVTPSVNIENIKAIGLVPSVGFRSFQSNELPGIFFFDNLVDVENAMMSWLGDAFEDDEHLTLLQISADEKQMETNDIGWEHISRIGILPEFISIHPLDLN